MAKVFEQVNRKCHRRNTILQLSAPYTNPEPSNFPPPKFQQVIYCSNDLGMVVGVVIVECKPDKFLSDNMVCTVANAVQFAFSSIAELLV